jgi:hypothetical protein
LSGGQPAGSAALGCALAPRAGTVSGDADREPSYYGALVSTDEDRLRLVSDLWEVIRGLTPDNVRNYPAAARAIDAGADPVDVVTAMTAAAYEATFGTLFTLTAEEDVQALAEAGAIDSLHEDLLSADPTGLEGADLFR